MFEKIWNKVKLIIEEIWNRYLIKIRGDKHWHEKAGFWGLWCLIILSMIFNLWCWVAILIAEATGFGKEIYDRFWGREKKFDWIDIVANHFGFVGAWIAINVTIWAYTWFYMRR